jgi:adenylate cyclase class 2
VHTTQDMLNPRVDDLRSTELEVKILDINVSLVKKRLQQIGAQFLGNCFQEIYTYNIYSVPSRIHELVTLDRLYGREASKDIRKLFKSLIAEINYLISAEDASLLNDLCVQCTGASWEEFQSRIEAYNYSEILNETCIIMQNYCTNNNKWARLRRTTTDQGVSTTTLTVKEITERVLTLRIGKHDISSLREIEIITDDFEKTKCLLENLGYYFKSYQQKKRTSYVIDDVYVDIDSWPLIPPYIEVEGKSARAISSIIDKLGIPANSSIVASPEAIFLRYGVDILSMRNLSF